MVCKAEKLTPGSDEIVALGVCDAAKSGLASKVAGESDGELVSGFSGVPYSFVLPFKTSGIAYSLGATTFRLVELSLQNADGTGQNMGWSVFDPQGHALPFTGSYQQATDYARSFMSR